MIRIKNVTKKYYLGKSEIHALRGIDIEINEGEMLCIMGPSGSGKSTLLNIIGCLDKPDSGEVMIANRSICGLGRNELAKIRANMIGFIFQSFNLVPVLNVYENIELPLYCMGGSCSRKEKDLKISKLIEEVGLKEYLRHRPDELSGGQRQRVAIARALVTSPKIVLADEPTANLDSVTADSIVSLMKTLNTEEKVTFVFSTHDPSLSKHTTSLCRLRDGVFEPVGGAA